MKKTIKIKNKDTRGVKKHDQIYLNLKIVI